MNKNCTLYKTTDIIGKRWTLLIILELYKGSSKYKRYSEIKRSIENITPKILSTRLKELESYDIIKKKVDSTEVPIKCFYSLTPAGKEFIKIIKDMKKWLLKWGANNKTCSNTECKDCKC